MDEIKSAIRFSLSKDDIWESIIDHIKISFEKSATNITELKQNSTKRKGNIFEVFCKAYLENAYDYYTQVWLLSEVPTDILEKLNLKRHDLGIDIIAVDKYNNYYAVQCKYRKKPEKRKNVLSWKELSTFYSLCLRTGSWFKYVVMTNADYVKREGKKTASDLSICYQTFKNTSREVWTKILGSEGTRLGSSTDPVEEKKEEKEEIVPVPVPIQSVKDDIRTLRSNFLNNLTLK